MVKLKTGKAIWLLVSFCVYHPLARPCLFCFPDLVYIYFWLLLFQVSHLGLTTASFLISLLLVPLLLDSSFPWAAKDPEVKQAWPCPSSENPPTVVHHAGMCLLRLERLQGPPSFLGAAWLSSLTSCLLPIPNSCCVSQVLPSSSIHDHPLSMLSHVWDFSHAFPGSRKALSAGQPDKL